MFLDNGTALRRANQQPMVKKTALARVLLSPQAAAIYCRISDDRTGEALGVKRQEVDCRKLAKDMGWTVRAVYVDNDKSAYSGKRRPEYLRLLDDIKAGIVDGLLAWHPDRLHRSPLELEEFIALVESAKVPVSTVQAGDYNLGTPAGRMSARVHGVAARHESEHKSERLKRKHKELAEEGRLSGGGDRPFGYNDDRLKLRAREAALIRTGAAELQAGASLRSVVRNWNASGIKTTRGHRWRTSGVRRVLNSARIAGLREYEGALYKAVWPRIISRADWEALRELFRDPGRRTNRLPRKYLLAGLLRCGRCNQKLVARPRAAECVRSLERQQALAAARAELAGLRARIRESDRQIAQLYVSDRKSLSLAIRRHDLLRAEEGQLKQRVKRLANGTPHVPMSLRDTLDAGSDDRKCLTCGSAVVSTPTYICAKDSSDSSCGKLRRLALPVEELVGELVARRVDGPQLQKALSAVGRRSNKAATAASDVAKLEARRDGLAKDFAKSLITRREWLVARDEVQAQIDALNAISARQNRTTVLTPYVGGNVGLAARWPKLSFDQKRAIVETVIDEIAVKPARRGLNKFDPSLIEPVWRF